MKFKLLASVIILAFFIALTPASAQTSPTSAGIRRLENTKMRACQSKEENIKTRMQSLVRLSKNMLERFNSIAQRVEEHYESKVLASGKSVANYDDLVAAIEAKKEAVETNLDTAQVHSEDFSCEDDPRGFLTTFRTNMQVVKNSLKEYRAAIKNLIVAIRTVNKGDE